MRIGLEVLEARDMPSGVIFPSLTNVPSPVTVQLFQAEAQIAAQAINAAAGAALIQASTLGPRGIADFVPQIIGLAEQAFAIELSLTTQFAQQILGIDGVANAPQ